MKSQKVKRPWGGYTVLKKTAREWVKKLYIVKNHRFSLQSHQFRNEVWYILSGKIVSQVGHKQSISKKGDVIFIPKNKKHRITGITNACILEVSYGGKVLENDIIRYEDDYGRS